jgi:cell division septation protein DedD
MKTFLVLILLANLAFFAWREGYTGDLLPQPAVYTEIPAVPAFEQAEHRLLLLQELPGAGDQSVAVATTPPEGTVEPEDEASLPTPPLETGEPVQSMPWCGELTGFAGNEAVSAFLAALPADQVSASVESREMPVSSTWWVHMPAFESETVALRMLEELQDNNIDSYYMRSGDLKGGISLGVFSRRESALTAQAQLARRGYATSIAEVFRMEERPVLKLRIADAGFLESIQWQDLLAGQDGPVLAENACEIIAPPSQFP